MREREKREKFNAINFTALVVPFTKRFVAIERERINEREVVEREGGREGKKKKQKKTRLFTTSFLLLSALSFRITFTRTSTAFFSHASFPSLSSPLENRKQLCYSSPSPLLAH